MQLHLLRLSLVLCLFCGENIFKNFHSSYLFFLSAASFYVIVISLLPSTTATLLPEMLLEEVRAYLRPHPHRRQRALPRPRSHRLHPLCSHLPSLRVFLSVGFSVCAGKGGGRRCGTAFVTVAGSCKGDGGRSDSRKRRTRKKKIEKKVNKNIFLNFLKI